MEIEIHTLTFNMVLKKPMTREQVSNHFQTAMEEISEKSKLHWINYFKKEGHECDNVSHFHISDKLYKFQGQKLCKDCIKDVLEADNTEDDL